MVPCEFQINEDNIPKYCKNTKNKNFMKKISYEEDDANHTFFTHPVCKLSKPQNIEKITAT